MVLDKKTRYIIRTQCNINKNSKTTIKQKIKNKVLIIYSHITSQQYTKIVYSKTIFPTKHYHNYVFNIFGRNLITLQSYVLRYL